jgi:hypothetical protein
VLRPPAARELGLPRSLGDKMPNLPCNGSIFCRCLALNKLPKRRIQRHADLLSLSRHALTPNNRIASDHGATRHE